MKRIVCAMSICLLGISLGTAVAEPQLSLEIYPEEMELRRYLRVWGSLRWDTPDALTDVYLAIIDEAGTVRFLSADLFDPISTPVPYISPLFVGEGSSVDNHFFGAFRGDILAFSSTTGSYLIALALTETDALNLVCEPAFATFQMTVVDPPRTWRDSRNNYATFEHRSARWYLTDIHLEVPHEWTYVYYDHEGSSGSDMTHFDRRGSWELDADGCGYLTLASATLGLNVYLTVYPDYASANAYGYNRNTLPNGAYIENWSLSTTLRP